MLETKDLTKIYRPKKGVPVTALEGVSLKFPDKGMIFLLGKSGSGKSTLLNLLGGLDRYDSGEIIIKGVSSKKFQQQHFDSYRNTYVGFIFQEYNILEDFTVGANIALAIELQGRKASDEELNRILAEVDLDGYGARRPNELSGGQKQRVAIARALVKNPKIIMADEPSGALDSVTGKQVFDTLKKLSKEKLVIVVSHDRDFANEYADRIIELADGKVISDTTVCESENIAEEIPQSVTFEGTTAKIPMGYHLTEEDRIAINEYIDKLQTDSEIEIIKTTKTRNFAPTNQENIKSEDNSPFKLIKSKLSFKHAFKIGGSGLKYKKFRLVMTILLSCIAFVLFGLVDTFSSYDHITTTANSIYDTGVKYAAVSKQIKVGDEDFSYWDQYGIKMSPDEIAELTNESGIDFKGVLTDDGMGYYFMDNIGDGDYDEYVAYDLYTKNFSGIVEVNKDDIDAKDYELVAGKMPDGSKNEILISKYVCDTFIKSGYREYSENGMSAKQNIHGYNDMVGKTLLIESTEYEVVGIVDTRLDMERYKNIIEQEEGGDAASQILDYVLFAEFMSAVENDYTGMMMVGEGFINRFMLNRIDAVPMSGINFGLYNDDTYVFPQKAAKLENVKGKVVWLNGERQKLGEKEIIITSDLIEYSLNLVEYDENNKIIVDKEKLSSVSLDLEYWDYVDTEFRESGYKIVGYIDIDYDDYKGSPNSGIVVLPDDIFDNYIGEDDGVYDLALGTMPMGKNAIKKLAEYCYTERDGVRFALNNPASFELDALDEIIDVLANVFLYIGIGFAVFAAILLSNFIATSISYKKQEIGILRAIGSRGNDVFRIFFSEAFIIAMINFVLACIGTSLITFIINGVLRDEVGLLITVLHFGIRQILVILAVSLGVAAIASFLPVKRIASKRPIDAIRNR